MKPRTSPDEKGMGVSTATDAVTGVSYVAERVAVKLAAMLNLFSPEGLHTCSMLMQLTLCPSGCTPPSTPPQVPER